MFRPSTFADPLERWVYSQRVDTIFSVELRPNPAGVLARWNVVHPIQGDQLAVQVENDRRAGISAMTAVGTGSLVNVDDTYYYVLTCAHLMAPVFDQHVHITPSEVNHLYEAFIICGHREQRYLSGLEHERIFRRGLVSHISCQNDLLVMRFSRAAMNGYCAEHENHQPQTFTLRVPRPLEKVVMISWPAYGRSMTTALGRFSSQSRLAANLGGDDVFGFPAELYEVDITTESGSSGGPIFDGEADTVGFLHGGNGKFSYFIRINEIINTLTNWGLLYPEA